MINTVIAIQIYGTNPMNNHHTVDELINNRYCSAGLAIKRKQYAYAESRSRQKGGKPLMLLTNSIWIWGQTYMTLMTKQRSQGIEKMLIHFDCMRMGTTQTMFWTCNASFPI